MNLQLTERDKKLLYYTGLFVLLVAVVYFFLMPGFDDITALHEQQSTLQQQYDMLVMQQNRIPSLQELVESSRQRWNTATTGYFDEMDSATADDFLTNLLLDYDLTPRNLDIAAPESSTMAAYLYSGSEEKLTLSAADNHISVIQVSGVAWGSWDNWLRLLDDLNDDYPGIHVVSFSVSTVQEKQDASTELVSHTAIGYALELYSRWNMEAE